MPAHCSYDYAVIRVVPRVEREEFVNVGVIVSCPPKDFLEARIELDEQRLLSLDPRVNLDVVRAHLASIPLICAGGPDAGPIGQLPRREPRFPLGGAPAASSAPSASTGSPNSSSAIPIRWPRSWRASAART